MVIIWGQRMYGRVDRFAGSHVCTRFFHIYYVPLIPLSSWLVFEELNDGKFVGAQVPMQLRSVMMAWLRVASVIALLVAGVNVIEAINSPYRGLVDGSSWAALGGLAAAFCVYAFFKLGKLSREDKARRVVYWDYAGKFVDVGLLEEGRGHIRQRTVEELDRHMVKHATAGYREAPQLSWRQIATRPDQRDVALLRAALTRSRVEWAEATGEARRSLEQDHEKIFANLVKASPDLLDVDKYEMRA